MWRSGEEEEDIVGIDLGSRLKQIEYEETVSKWVHTGKAKVIRLKKLKQVESGPVWSRLEILSFSFGSDMQSRSK